MAVATVNKGRNDMTTDSLRTTMIKNARKLIERPENWTKGRYITMEADYLSYCAVGALKTARNKLQNNAIESHCQKNVYDTYWSTFPMFPDKLSDCMLVRYNDAPERTHEEILTLFDQAIKNSEAADQQCG